MTQEFCNACRMSGICARLTVNVVQADELENPQFRYDVSATAYGLNLRHIALRVRLVDEHAAFVGRVTHKDGSAAAIDPFVFDPLDGDVEAHSVNRADDDLSDCGGFHDNGLRWLAKHGCAKPDLAALPPLRPQSLERWITFATILKIMMPNAARRWGVNLPPLDAAVPPTLARTTRRVPLHHLSDQRRLDYIRRAGLVRAFRENNTARPRAGRDRRAPCPYVALIPQKDVRR